MMNSTRVLQLIVCFVAVAAMLCLAMPAAAWGTPIVIPVGQSDDFHDGLDNWLGGGSGMMAVGQQLVSGGGPGGALDQYLQVNSGGSSNAPRLLVSNTGPSSQWVGGTLGDGGDFSSITAITADILSPTSNINLTTPFTNTTPTLSMRLAIREGTANSSAGYVTTLAQLVPSDGQWHHVTFFLDAADMTAVSAGSPAHAPPAFNTLKADVLDFRILDATSPVLVGDAFSSSGPQIEFGIDNITAVPEPTSFLLAALAGSGLIVLRRRLRR